MAEKSKSEDNSEQLIHAAYERRWITTEEREHLNELRMLRNPIIYFRESKANFHEMQSTAMKENDAKMRLGAAMRLLGETAL